MDRHTLDRVVTTRLRVALCYAWELFWTGVVIGIAWVTWSMGTWPSFDLYVQSKVREAGLLEAAPRKGFSVSLPGRCAHLLEPGNDDPRSPWKVCMGVGAK